MPTKTPEQREMELRQSIEHLTALGARVEVDYGLCDADSRSHGVNCDCFAPLERPRVARYVIYGAWKEYKPHEWPKK